MTKWRPIIILLLSVLLISGCAQMEDKNDVKSNPDSRTEFLMGTYVTVKIYNEGKKQLLDEVFDRVKILAGQIDVNQEKNTEVEEINANAGIKPVKVSDDIFLLIQAGRYYSELAEGSFDISVGPLTKLWHIGFPDERKPEQEEINEVLPLINYSDIELDEQNKTVFLRKKGMALDLGAIAKGFIADEVVKILKENDVTSAIVDLGGNVVVIGKNSEGKDWAVGIQNPFSSRGQIAGKLNLSDKSVVTSGIYERFIEVDGIRYHHLLNPKDGYPFDNDIAGVSVITDKSTDGDSLSTLLFSKGIDGGLEFVEGLEGVEAIFISKSKEVYLSSGLKDLFEITNDEFIVAD